MAKKFYDAWVSEKENAHCRMPTEVKVVAAGDTGAAIPETYPYGYQSMTEQIRSDKAMIARKMSK
jgi:hypothetical protein